ncbi:DUF4214 domain-containing protein [Acinetobacter brisouii]|uniref:DUF4214 domain-containing protein n=1 Tax=Acinetobacter brisouii TaxID=396323 RepID=UPI00124FEB76|nr:DUF4214 domain-containing protein [Acinetobacter brisouii]
MKYIRSIDDLIGLNGVEFIKSVYLFFLGRSPDEVGLAFYMARLKQGYSKNHILTDIINSKEAQDKINQVAGGAIIKSESKLIKRFLRWILSPFTQKPCTISRLEFQLYELKTLIDEKVYAQNYMQINNTDADYNKISKQSKFFLMQKMNTDSVKDILLGFQKDFDLE